MMEPTLLAFDKEGRYYGITLKRKPTAKAVG